MILHEGPKDYKKHSINNTFVLLPVTRHEYLIPDPLSLAVL
jgi:hypothetical protein